MSIGVHPWFRFALLPNLGRQRGQTVLLPNAQCKRLHCNWLYRSGKPSNHRGLDSLPNEQSSDHRTLFSAFNFLLSVPLPFCVIRVILRAIPGERGQNCGFGRNQMQHVALQSFISESDHHKTSRRRPRSP